MGVKYYTFQMKEEYGNNLTAPVIIFPSGSYPDVDIIHLYEVEKKKWISFTDWRHTAVDEYAFAGKYANRIQRGW